VQYEEFGLIDHIAASDHFAKPARLPEFWQRENNRDGTMSDHCDVAVGFTTSISRPSREAQVAQQHPPDIDLVRGRPIHVGRSG
jgi:hypothetical protein